MTPGQVEQTLWRIAGPVVPCLLLVVLAGACTPAPEDPQRERAEITAQPLEIYDSVRVAQGKFLDAYSWRSKRTGCWFLTTMQSDGTTTLQELRPDGKPDCDAAPPERSPVAGSPR